jgi:superfamily I DNA/RNA helicase
MIEYRAIGPPGCGKTTWLSKQVKNAVSKHGPDSVLLASLTKAAAAELAGRDLPINPESVGTLHAHAFRALDRPQLAQDKKHIEAWNAHVSNRDHPSWRLTQWLKQDDMGRAATEEASEGDKLLEAAEMYRHRCAPMEIWPDRVRAWFQAWQDFKEMSYAMDFTDMIVKATEVIEHAPGNPRFIFLDEAQDLSLLELNLARTWAEHCEVFIMVGDPDQCLYEWRGSSPLNFESPKLEERYYKYLSQSYRVPAAVHRVAVRWIERIKDRRKVEYYPRVEGDEPVEGICRKTDLSYQDAQYLIRDAKANLEAGRSIMFLGTAGYMLHPLIKYMRQEGIPFHNPYNTKRGDWNPLGSVARRGTISMAERIRAFAYGEWISDWDELAKWLKTLKLDHFRAGKYVTHEFIRREVKGKHDLKELNNILTDEAIKRAFEGDFEWLRSGMTSTYKDLASTKYAIKVCEKFGETTLGKSPQIVIGTIHSVKGGQADVVYVFPDLSPAADDEWFSGQKARAGIYRAFYVAMTRAREELVLCGPSKQGRAVDFPRLS